MTLPAPYEKSKFLGSGGSMVARLKLKGIDGRAPPGVNHCQVQRPKVSRKLLASVALPQAMRHSPNCGEALKLCLPSQWGNSLVARVAPSGMVTTAEMHQWAIRSQAPKGRMCVLVYGEGSETKWQWACHTFYFAEGGVSLRYSPPLPRGSLLEEGLHGWRASRRQQ